ncbi:MAG: hypothetical protein MAG581_01712 [Deltaproteobacteria bacterium]|jgi:hypothetical protein|nr:hypothetical protein [Deltaproteobacteria bacterium]
MLCEIWLMLQEINQVILLTKYFFSSIEIGDDNSGVEVYVRWLSGRNTFCYDSCSSVSK